MPKQSLTNKTGLTEEEVLASRARHGDNRLPAPTRKGFFSRLLAGFADPIIRILLIALLIEVVVLFRDIDWFEVGGILLAIGISTLVSTVSEYGSEKAFLKLRDASSAHPCRVIRAGRTVACPCEELVVGDLVCLSAGEMVPADCVMAEGELLLDQSPLNGESAEVEKRKGASHRSWDLSHPEQIFRGSLVAQGEGYATVSRVGGQTVYGTLARELGTDTVRESPLKQRLSRLATQISRLGYCMAALVALAYFFRAFFVEAGFDCVLIADLFADRAYLASNLMHMLTLAITVIVVSVPEGLPMMITVVLSSNMKRMLKDNVLVRKMVGIETAGHMNILFTDKTGTLTGGRMQVGNVIFGGGETLRLSSLAERAPTLLAHLQTSAMLNTDSTWSAGGAIGGNATDRAILAAFYRKDLTAKPLSKLPFTSARKYAAVQTGDGVYIKGAPELLLARTAEFLDPAGNRHPYTADASRKTENACRAAQKRGERVVAVCRADRMPKGEREGLPPLVLVALLVISDGVRHEAPASVATLHRAGVQVVMVTGDARETAGAVAAATGILASPSPDAFLSGVELDALTDDELAQRLPHLRVVWRARPQDKSRLVRVAQSLGLVTGMTGDGINDAPSLKAADVGFSMGSGTEIAKEAGDVVLLDDNISSVTKTVLYGRTIFSSIRKFICFQLTMNLCAVGVSLIGPFIGIESPVTILQMLWVNIIMDTLGGLAFAGEPPLASYMKEPPKKREESLLSPKMLHQILLTGAYTLGLCVWFLCSRFARENFGGGEVNVAFLTAFFALFIFCGLANCLCARSERLSLFAHIGRNRPFLLILLFISCVQILMIYRGGSLFRTVPLAFPQLAGVIGLALSVLPVDFLRRVIYLLTKPTRA